MSQRAAANSVSNGMLGLRLRVHDVLPGLAALKPRRIRRMTTDEARELLCNIQGTIAARLIAISQARFAAGGSTNIISIFRPSSRHICRSPDSLLIRLLRLLADVRPRVRD